MFANVQLFQTSGALMRYAATRQSLVAQNLSNADTPGYRAQDLPNFSDAIRLMKTGDLDPIRDRSVASPNGNNVSLEEQLIKAGQAKRDHDYGLAIYRSSLSILRSTLGRT